MRSLSTQDCAYARARIHSRTFERYCTIFTRRLVGGVFQENKLYINFQIIEFICFVSFRFSFVSFLYLWTPGQCVVTNSTGTIVIQLVQ